jgi:hypothetical protein
LSTHRPEVCRFDGATSACVPVASSQRALLAPESSPEAHRLQLGSGGRPRRRDPPSTFALRARDDRPWSRENAPRSVAFVRFRAAAGTRTPATATPAVTGNTGCGHQLHVGSCAACQRAQLSRWSTQLVEARAAAQRSKKPANSPHSTIAQPARDVRP